MYPPLETSQLPFTSPMLLKEYICPANRLDKHDLMPPLVNTFRISLYGLKVKFFLEPLSKSTWKRNFHSHTFPKWRPGYCKISIHSDLHSRYFLMVYHLAQCCQIEWCPPFPGGSPHTETHRQFWWTAQAHLLSRITLLISLWFGLKVVAHISYLHLLMGC